MNSLVKQAFLSVCNGYSPDRVVADPILNAAFVEKCAALRLALCARDLNKRLLNLRKGGDLKDVGTTRRTTFSNEDIYRHGSEVAIRFLENVHQATLDDIICDPVLVQEFDRISDEIAPGFHPLQYRWAALNLRKSRQLQPELLSHVVPSEAIQLGKVASLTFSDIPMGQGVYVFYGPTETLYVGEAENLRKRLVRHLDHSDNKGLARWFWEHGFDNVHLEIRVLPTLTSTRIRRALEAELIMSRSPVFNIQMK